MSLASVLLIRRASHKAGAQFFQLLSAFRSHGSFGVVLLLVVS